MGFNIAGLVINQNYNKDILKLSADLKWGIEVIEEVTFEKACSNWTPDGEFRLYFSDQATMIFIPHEWVANQSHSKTADTLNYAYSATTMAFQVDLFKNGKLVRSILEHEGDRKISQGKPLELEKNNETADGLTFALFDELLKTDFSDLDLDDKAFRCKKVKYVEPDAQEIEKQTMKEAFAKENAGKSNKSSTRIDDAPQDGSQKSEPKTKKWWQFWN